MSKIQEKTFSKKKDSGKNCSTNSAVLFGPGLSRNAACHGPCAVAWPQTGPKIWVGFRVGLDYCQPIYHALRNPRARCSWHESRGGSPSISCGYPPFSTNPCVTAPLFIQAQASTTWLTPKPHSHRTNSRKPGEQRASSSSASHSAADRVAK